jgi:hypothetical protein
MNWKAFAWRRRAGRDHGGVEGQVDCGMTVLCGRAIEAPALQTAGYVLIIAAASS